ncbi:hypothetical protein [Pseudonocardia sp.]|uniref:hypothetical protein n=1 Tax=Pseudonocardia sp. TaxID=60912 RepID=UPI003D0C5663
MSPHVLGLDPSLTGFGVARYTETQRIDTWVKGTDSLPKDAPILASSARIEVLYRWLFRSEANLVNANTVLAIVEEPLKATHGGAGLGKPIERHWLFGRIIDGFRLRDIPVAVINPTWVKMYIAGHGRADKGTVKRAVAASWPGQGLGRIGDNEADAVTLAAMGADWLGWDGPWLDGRRGVDWLKKANWPERESVRA